MDLKEAIQQRHSVRRYMDKAVDSEVLEALRQLVDECNQQSGLHIQMITDEPKAFDCAMARYGRFSGVSNYFAMIGQRSDKLDETIGYYGERLVLEAQRLGLNTCWVGLTFKKIPEVLSVDDGERLRAVISFGYGVTMGHGHRVKSFERVTRVSSPVPTWFRDGVEAALLAPTAVNQQQFRFTLRNDGKVEAKAGLGYLSKMDLGIVKLHFEIGAGREYFEWA